MSSDIVPTTYATAADAWDAAARYRRMAHTAWEAGWVPQAEAYDRQWIQARDAWKQMIQSAASVPLIRYA